MSNCAHMFKNTEQLCCGWCVVCVWPRPGKWGWQGKVRLCAESLSSSLYLSLSLMGSGEVQADIWWHSSSGREEGDPDRKTRAEPKWQGVWFWLAEERTVAAELIFLLLFLSSFTCFQLCSQKDSVKVPLLCSKLLSSPISPTERSPPCMTYQDYALSPGCLFLSPQCLIQEDWGLPWILAFITSS